MLICRYQQKRLSAEGSTIWFPAYGNGKCSSADTNSKWSSADTNGKWLSADSDSKQLSADTLVRGCLLTEAIKVIKTKAILNILV